MIQTIKRRIGRPKGAKTKPAPHVVSVLARCPKCSSTDYERLDRLPDQQHAGHDQQGNPFTHIVRRRCRCRKCGQMMIERTHENRA